MLGTDKRGGSPWQNRDKMQTAQNFRLSCPSAPNRDAHSIRRLVCPSSPRRPKAIVRGVMYARYIPPAKGSTATSSPKPAPPRLQEAPVPAVAAAPADGYSYSRYVPGAAPAVKKPTVQYFDDEPQQTTPKRKRETIDEAHAGGQDNKKLRTLGEEEKIAASRQGSRPALQQEDGAKKKKNRRKRKQRTKADSDDSGDSDDEPARRDAIETQDFAKPEPEPELQLQNTSVADIEDTKVEKKKRKEKSKQKTMDPEPQEQSPEPTEGDVEMIDVAESSSATIIPEADTSTTEVAKKAKKEKQKKEKKKKKSEDVATEPEDQDEDLRHKAVLERKEKSLKLAIKATLNPEAESTQEPVELHGLEPLPQPAVVPDDESKPTYDTLPPWLANPIRVSQDTQTPFSELGILPKAARVLEQKGFAEAFAVQTAAIPLLLPSDKHRPGDVLISAATGSGKTLAYALPIVRDLSQGVVTRLRALVVLPTRELVKQAQEVFETCARAYDGEERKKVRIGVAVGSQSIKNEQQNLLWSESRHDPEAYQKLKGEKLQKLGSKTGSAADDGSADLDADSVAEKNPRIGAWEGEVVDFFSKVDILICTPGRLVEHVEQTPGFSLDYVRWLVVDEADKLLAQSFQGWLDLIMERFKVERFSARDFVDMDYSGVRKVVLSATLTRDLSLLNQLELRRPRLIVLESDGALQIAEHSLPPSLKEFAIRVHESNLKPLYLLDLLRGPHMTSVVGGGDLAAPDQKTMDSAQALDSDTSSDSGTSSGSDTSSESETSSDADTSSDSDSDTSSSGSEDDRKPALQLQSQLPQALIFTKSNESAIRLARLLVLLDPSLSTRMATLTSTTPTHIRRKTLRAFGTPSSPVRLIIASDLVARGIDIPNLGHVVNYDLPPSVASYVHRVGRTARAGRSGCAWTLVGDDESGWFWGKIAKGQSVRRAQKVERTRIEEMSEERTREYEDALSKLGKEALEMRRG
ncbi:hypothetical protein HIM_00345 [Hirsutella minnesotensis 3608]|nr:hypothetical protein HIM_00345 [Hirsutella minnesotensis 3608]